MQSLFSCLHEASHPTKCNWVQDGLPERLESQRCTDCNLKWRIIYGAGLEYHLAGFLTIKEGPSFAVYSSPYIFSRRVPQKCTHLFSVLSGKISCFHSRVILFVKQKPKMTRDFCSTESVIHSFLCVLMISQNVSNDVVINEVIDLWGTGGTARGIFRHGASKEKSFAHFFSSPRKVKC